MSKRAKYKENRKEFQRKAYGILEDLDEGEGLTDSEFVREWLKRYDSARQYGRWAIWDLISGEAAEEKLDRVTREESEAGHVYTIYGKEGKYDEKKIVTPGERKLKKWNSDLTRKYDVKDISRIPIELFEDWAKRQEKYYNSNWEITKHQEFRDLKKNIWENVLMAESELEEMKDTVVYLEILNSGSFDRYELRVEHRKFKDQPMRMVGESDDYPTSFEKQELYGLPIQSGIVENKIEDNEEIIRCVENMVREIENSDLFEETLEDLNKWKKPRNLEKINKELKEKKKEGRIKSNKDLFNLLVGINLETPFYPPYDQEHGNHIVRDSGFHALLEKYRRELGPKAGTVDTVKGLLEGVKKKEATKEGKSKAEKRQTYIDHAKDLLEKFGEKKF